jgi:hypothetical protein
MHAQIAAIITETRIVQLERISFLRSGSAASIDRRRARSQITCRRAYALEQLCSAAQAIEPGQI